MIKKKIEKKIENHLHCPECGEVLREIYRLPLERRSVKIIYSCGRHLYLIAPDWDGKLNPIGKEYWI